MNATTAPTTRTLTVERDLPHPPAKVWRALTQSALLADWLMANDFAPRVGHKFNFRSTPMPQWNGVIDCEVLAVEPEKRLSYRWAALGLETVVTFTLTPNADRHASAHGAIRLPLGRGQQLSRRYLRLAALCREISNGCCGAAGLKRAGANRNHGRYQWRGIADEWSTA